MNKTVALTSNSSWYLFKFRKGTIHRLVSEGYEVVCIAAKDSYSSKLEDMGARFVAVPLTGKSINPFKEFYSIISIFSVLLELKPRFVFNHTIKMNLYVGFCCSILKIKYSNNISGLGTVFLHKRMIYSIAKKLYGITNKKAYRVFFQNEEDMDLFIKLNLVSKKSIKLLPGSGINLFEFAFTPIPKRKSIIFIMISRLIADKGVREFIGAAKILKENNHKARFILLGPSDVSNKSAISHEEVANWQKEGLIEYVGNQDDVRPWIKEAHVLVLPSYREGMPRTVLEAASIGRPSIVTNVPGCRQAVINGETGWYCEVGSKKSLSQTMLHVMNLPSEKIDEFGLRARKLVQDEFSEDKVISHYMQCLSF